MTAIPQQPDNLHRVSPEMARFLVTGGTGFIGSHLVDELLKRGQDLTCLARHSARADKLGRRSVRLVEADLLDANGVARAVENCDVVFHLAGSTRSLFPDSMYETNVSGTRNVVAACAAQSNPPILIVASSLAASGPSNNGKLRREVDPCAPVSVYGHSKRDAEKVTVEYADRVPVSIVRPPIVFGPRDQATLPLFKAIRRTHVHLMPGYQRRLYSLIHVADLVEALILTAEKGSRVPSSATGPKDYSEGCYFAADQQQVTYRELGSLIAHALGRRFVVNLPIPDWTVWTAAIVSERISRLRGEAHVLNVDKAREATAGSWVCSADKIRTELGFVTKASLSERLDETTDSYWKKQML